VLTSTTRLVTYGERIGQLAAEHPAKVAVRQVAPNGTTVALTWDELERRTNVAARGLADHGVTAASTVAIGLPPGLDHVIATIAAWKCAALVVPFDPTASPAERAALAAALGGHVSIGTGTWATIRPGWWQESTHSDAPMAVEGLPRAASLTGGTTGLPRVILRPRPWAYEDGAWLASHERGQGMRLGQIQLVALPLYHTGFHAIYQGLALDHEIIVMTRFVPSLFPKLVAEYRVSHVRLVAALMRMILDVPDLANHDLSSIESVHHGAGPCPEPVKRAWLDLLGPDRVYEVYASQERIGRTEIRGDEWLQRPGSVGRPAGCDIRILDADGQPLPAGQVGEVYLGSPTAKQPEYIGGGPLLAERDGFFSVGDLGYLDADGYLYLVDRKSNVINVGGTNVYAAEVEAALLEHPEVADAVVTGRPHDYLGQTVHALVVPVGSVDSAVLDAHCRGRLSTAKVPMSYELVAEIPRRSSGKVRRSDL